MPRLRTLSAKEIIKFLGSHGFVIDRQKGSHITLVRDGVSRQVLTIPNHKELDRGTAKAIYNQSMRFIAEGDLKKFFYR